MGISKYEQKTAITDIRKQLKSAGIPPIKWSGTAVRGWKRIAQVGFEIYGPKHPDMMHELSISFPSDADAKSTGPEAAKLSAEAFKVLKKNGWNPKKNGPDGIRVDLKMDENVLIIPEEHLQERKMLKSFKNAKEGLDFAMKMVKDSAYQFVGTKEGALTIAYADKKKGEEVKKKMQSAGLHVDEKWHNNKLQLGVTWVFSMQMKEDLDENTSEGGEMTGQMGVGTNDMANTDAKLKTKKKVSVPSKKFKGMPVFEMDSSDEYHSFSKGVKTFKRWSQHTKSEDVRAWANENKGKSFYICHNENYTYINRGK